jgi:hypothetical protein
VRQTSIAAYNQIKADGTLSRMRWKVYDYLFHHGPLTRTEVDMGLKGPGEVNPSYHKRLSELERQGVVTTVGRKTCNITGKECELWDVTALATPIPFDATSKSPSRKERQAAAAELRDIYKVLVAQGHQGFSDNLVRVCKWLAAK